MHFRVECANRSTTHDLRYMCSCRKFKFKIYLKENPLGFIKLEIKNFSIMSKIQNSKSKIFFFVLLTLISIFLYRQFIYFPKSLEVAGSNTQEINFEIQSGESVRSIAKRLEVLGIIADNKALLNYLAKENLDTKIHAGYFHFQGNERIPEVAKILLKGEVKQISLTILEGWNVFDIDKKLTKLGLIEANDFALFVREGGALAGNELDSIFANRPVASLEGYLFPATYKIDPANFSIENLTARMLQAMEQNLHALNWNSNNSERSLHEILTMASIVELEDRSEENRPKVADILWRRFDTGQGLYADATLFYILGHQENLTAADLAIDSPYNTRKNRGLPPTPICAPSRSAIQSAMYPEANEFWYYLHGSDGEIHFGKTLEEHGRNKFLFLDS
jgi:UPF0755 protein